jgi:hypothetical protein
MGEKEKIEEDEQEINIIEEETEEKRIRRERGKGRKI